MEVKRKASFAAKLILSALGYSDQTTTPTLKKEKAQKYPTECASNSTLYVSDNPTSKFKYHQISP